LRICNNQIITFFSWIPNQVGNDREGENGNNIVWKINKILKKIKIFQINNKFKIWKLLLKAYLA